MNDWNWPDLDNIPLPETPSESTAPAAEPTAPAVEPTAPAVEPVASVAEPTAPAVEPTAPAVERPSGFAHHHAADQPSANGWNSQTGYAYPQPVIQPQMQPPVQPPVQTYAPTYVATDNRQPSPYGSAYPTTAYAPYTGYPQQQPPVAATPKRRKTALNVLMAILLALLLIALTVCAVLGVQQVMRGQEDRPADTSSESYRPTDPDTSDSSFDPDVSRPSIIIHDTEVSDGGLSTPEIVQKNLDSTVVLTMYHKASTLNNSYFGLFGGDPDDDSLTDVGAASGIVMSEDGYIITNAHCVFDENYNVTYARIEVTTYSGKSYDATIIGYDTVTDLAVIKVDATGMTPAEFGSSDALTLGDRAIALGNSGGLAWSVTQGIISGLARDVYEDTGYALSCLQTDAAINPGNSGGPLLNCMGQVVGINSAKIVAEEYEGLGFSIPINEAKVILDALMHNGYVPGRVSIGITGQTITQSGYEGFYISTFSENSPLAQTEAQVGDIITHVDGVRVKDYSELRSELAKHEVGDTVSLTLLRVGSRSQGNRTITVICTLAESRG